MKYLEGLGENAKQAGRILALVSTEEKNQALKAIAKALVKNSEEILRANKQDVDRARADGVSEAFIDRLSLDEKRISDMADGLNATAKLPDPIGEVLEVIKRDNGLEIKKVRVPLGVIGIIYEARPNVTSDAAGLCLKTGNPVILRGGSRAFETNRAVANTMKKALVQVGLSEHCIQLVEKTDRKTATEMMKLNKYIKVLIPRGGASLIDEIIKNATIPVIETGTGICHIYVDSKANQDMAISIILNAKTSHPSVCNAVEVLLVNEEIHKEFLPKIYNTLEQNNVEVRGCEKTKAILKKVIPAKQADWDTEFLDYVIAVKVVKDIKQAIDHINNHGTGHSDAIITEDKENAVKFTQGVDASAVYVNASTRFTDGGEFGMGAEIGISTQMLHARGPMGLKELTSYKYIVTGSGQIR